LGLEPSFSSFMSYIMALADSSLHELPVSIKNYSGTFYSTELAKEQRDWNNLLAIADTASTSEAFTEYDRQMSRAYAYYMMDKPEKARQAATLAAKEVSNKPFLNRTQYIYVLMGKKEKALNNYKQHLAGRFVTESHNQQDLAEVCNRLVDWIQLQAFAGEYEAATQSLIQLNRDYPKFGGYQMLSTGMWTYKIRQAYPPFNEALRNLKLPPKLKMPDEYNDM
jgi:tetratricopeptide (TPR) repeat protein